MTERISLVEAYDNRDVIAQLVRLRDDVDELLNILKDIDPNGDLTNVVTKTGDQTIDGVKTFIGQIVADCDIIQNGAAYETHAEQVFSVNDYIVTRDGQITGLAPGDLSGFHVKKYNGVDDSRLGVDNTGTMRVGDVGQEQPLATRDEVADMTSGALVKWDGVNQKLIAPDSTIGSDDRPVKIVGGVPTAIERINPSVTGMVAANLTLVGGNVTLLSLGSIDDAYGGEYLTYDAGTKKFTVVKSGRYLINMSVKIQSDTVGKAEVAMSKNSTVEYVSSQIWIGATNTNFGSNFSMIDKASVGDTYGLCGWVASGTGTITSGPVSRIDFIRLGD